MNNFSVLWGTVICGAFTVMAADLGTNQSMMGDQLVDATVSNGTISGDRWMVICNTLIQVHSEVAPIEPPPGSKAPGGDHSPLLYLMLYVCDCPMNAAKVNGLHGLMYMAGSWQTPNLAQTNRVDILSTADKTKIVIMVRDNGPIYSSTNSGVSWKVISTPGKHVFPLTMGPGLSGFYAEATLWPSNRNGESNDFPPANWYVIGSADDGGKMVMTGNSSPVLSIKYSGNTVILSWPTNFMGFTVHQDGDLSTAKWADVTNSANVERGEIQVVISPIATNQFYRLKSQLR